ncbi:unnamed protein product [Amaranthus hypochondriacus]
MAGEYLLDFVDKKALVERLCKVLGAEKVEIEYDYHSLSNKVEEVVQTIIDFVKRETPKGWDDRCCGNFTILQLLSSKPIFVDIC